VIKLFTPLFFLLLTASYSIAQQFDDLRITEIMYSAPDQPPYVGTSLEFIEIKNTGTQDIDLTGVIFSSGIIYSFPAGSAIAGNDFIVLVSNIPNFKIKYPGVTPFGNYLGGLKGKGEAVTLADNRNNDSLIITSVNYNDNSPWPVTADGHGFSIVPTNNNPNRNQNNSWDWRSSKNSGGSPGADDPSPIWYEIIINEVLPHTDLPQLDAVELFNPGIVEVPIGGWYLTDDRNNVFKYQIPVGVTLKPGEYKVFDESDFNTTPGVLPSFSFNRVGEGVYLFELNGLGALTGYAHGVNFGAQKNGWAFGKYTTSVGEVHYPVMSSVSLNQQNPYPRIGPVVIDKIMYNPPAGKSEFVVLRNITTDLIPLYNELYPAEPWKIAGINFFFPLNQYINPDGYVVVGDTTPAVLRSMYNIPVEVPVYGPYLGTLQNSGESLELQWPDKPDTNNIGVVFTPYVIMDAVRYNDKLPWPEDADGLGKYLKRNNKNEYGNDPINWTSDDNFSNIVGVQEIIGDANIKMFPNPTTGDVRLMLEDISKSDLESVIVYNAIGMKVLEVEIPKGSHELVLPAGKLAPGLYSVVLSGKKSFVKKLVVQ